MYYITKLLWVLICKSDSNIRIISILINQLIEYTLLDLNSLYHVALYN